MTAPMRVLITGAAGNVGYNLAFRIAAGDVFGDRDVILHLFVLTQSLGAAEGIAMELNDSAFEHLAGVIYTDQPSIGFKDVDAAFLVGAFPRKAGMDRADLINRNAAIFKEHGAALSQYANKNVKVVVVGNPANTNAAIACHFAPNLRPENFCALTRLDHNRAQFQIAKKLGIKPCHVKNVIIWGNHSNTQVPDCSYAFIEDDGAKKKVVDVVDDEFLKGSFITIVQSRGSAVIKVKGSSSAASAASAAANCMRDWFQGTKEGEWVSMAVPVTENNEYGIGCRGLFYSMPVQIDKNGNVSVVKGLEVTDFHRKMMKITEDELVNEFQTAMSLL